MIVPPGVRISIFLSFSSWVWDGPKFFAPLLTDRLFLELGEDFGVDFLCLDGFLILGSIIGWSSFTMGSGVLGVVVFR